MRSSEIQVKAQVEEKYVFLYLLFFFVLELYFSSTLPVFPLSPLTCSFEEVGNGHPLFDISNKKLYC